MNPKTLLILAILTAAVPAALAHDPAGTPKNYCETTVDTLVHDYGPPASGRLIFSPRDGNLGGDCDNSGLNFGNLGTPCAGFDDPNNALTFFVGLCGSRIQVPAADFDGHYEHAFGGAILTVDDGPCAFEDGHHNYMGSYLVEDIVLGYNVLFTVTADRFSLVPPTDPNTPDCGDRQSDESIDCIGSCFVPFGPGLDGTYRIFVQGTSGHIRDGQSPTGDFIFDCTDRVDNDSDGNADWPNDPGCDSPADDNEGDEGIRTECVDGLDNDQNGAADWPLDPGCTTPGDGDESSS